MGQQLPPSVSKGADAELSLVISDRTQGNGRKLHQVKFKLVIEKGAN